jgi:hypothetical protein
MQVLSLKPNGRETACTSRVFSEMPHVATAS